MFYYNVTLPRRERGDTKDEDSAFGSQDPIGISCDFCIAASFRCLNYRNQSCLLWVLYFLALVHCNDFIDILF